jgi:DNA-binding MarR family transcriptional regulator
MDIQLFWKLLSCGRTYGEAACRKFRFAGNTTDSKLCLYLLSHPGISQYDLAFAYQMAACTVAKALSRLEKEGLVQRTVNPRDRRARVVSLSPRGAAAYAEVLQIQSDWARQVSLRLTEAENAEFDRLCRKALLGAEELLTQQEP